jgi:hypothetical protein
MTTTELKAALIEEGCNEANFAIGNRGTASDTFCLIHQNVRWEVFYTERGSDDPPLYAGTSEHDACVFFKHHILSQQHWHMVGFFCRESEALALEVRIRSLGVQPVRNDIPAFQQPGDARYRVFVMGKDIFPVRQAIPGVPIRRD